MLTTTATVQRHTDCNEDTQSMTVTSLCMAAHGGGGASANRCPSPASLTCFKYIQAFQFYINTMYKGEKYKLEVEHVMSSATMNVYVQNFIVMLDTESPFLLSSLIFVILYKLTEMIESNLSSFDLK